MAETPDSKLQTQEFLAQMERQRLSKPCSRVIDLRGKVAGECQAYTFGGRTHYLDDRGYLIVKQLLDRFNGRYTIGVYETLLKALKKLSENDADRATRDNEQEILQRSGLQPQLIAFDQLLHRKEARILYATAVNIRVADVLYHAATNDITCSAIRVTMKRAHTLAKGDHVQVSFPEFCDADAHSPMLSVPYRIIKIDHDDKRTYAVFFRNRDENSAVSTFLDQWTDAHQTAEFLDLDNELYNIASRFYLRIYTRKLATPLLWLSTPVDDSPVKAFHMMHAADHILGPLLDSQGHIRMHLLPLRALMQNGQDYIVVINHNDSFTALRSDTQAVRQLLRWHQQQAASTVFLLQTTPQHIDGQLFQAEMGKIADRDNTYAQQLSERLASIHNVISITDISSCCGQLSLTETEDMAGYQLNESMVSNFKLPAPTSLQHHIKRSKERYFIHTQICLHTAGQTLDLTTSDVSATGLSIKLPVDSDISIGSRVKVDFVKWQNQAPKTQLSGLPFLVRNSRRWGGELHLGLQRITEATSQRVNDFFDEVLEKNRDSLRRDDDDIIHSQETRIFSSLLTKTMTTIPLYLGLSADNKRILQAVATTETNQAVRMGTLWQAIAANATQLAEIVRNLPSDISATSFGLYCYYSRGNWVVGLEQDFKSKSEKNLFINRALKCERFLFYLCDLAPVQSKTLEQEADLHEQLVKLRKHSVHKVKLIREILSDLFAVGILTDVTDIIEAAYR